MSLCFNPSCKPQMFITSTLRKYQSHAFKYTIYMFCFQPFIRLLYPDHIKRKPADQRHRCSLRLRIYLGTAGSWKTLRLTIGSAAAAGFQKRLFQIFLRINVTFLLWSVEPPPPILASKLQLTAAAQYLAPSLFARAPIGVVL